MISNIWESSKNKPSQFKQLVRTSGQGDLTQYYQKKKKVKTCKRKYFQVQQYNMVDVCKALFYTQRGIYVVGRLPIGTYSFRTLQRHTITEQVLYSYNNDQLLLLPVEVDWRYMSVRTKCIKCTYILIIYNFKCIAVCLAEK